MTGTEGSQARRRPSNYLAHEDCGHPTPAMPVECVCHCPRCADYNVPMGEPGYCICPQCTLHGETKGGDR